MAEEVKDRELRGKDGRLYGKLRDDRYLVIKRGSKTEVIDLQADEPKEQTPLKAQGK